MKNTTEQFEELMIPRKELHISDAMFYRVYHDRIKFELVQAVSALDALSQSKVKNVYKIERHDPMSDNVIHLQQVMAASFPENKPANEHKEIVIENQIEQLPEQDFSVAPVVEDVVIEASTVESEPVLASPPAASDAPLSNDDVDRLLNGG